MLDAAATTIAIYRPSRLAPLRTSANKIPRIAQLFSFPRVSAPQEYGFASSYQYSTSQHILCSAQGAEEASHRQGNGSSSFFNRDKERESLQMYLDGRPHSILVIVGPRSSGKTRLLQETLAEEVNDWDSTDSDFEPQRSFLPIYLNGRTRKLTEASAFARQLQLSLQERPGIWNWFKLRVKELGSMAAMKLTMRAGPLEAIEQKADVQQISSIESIIATFNEIFSLYADNKASFNNWPVICIDEANVLMEWKKEQTPQLAELMRFFVAITKEAGTAHVVLATSEYGFLSWLESAIQNNPSEVEVVGDFSKDEAKLFFTKYALPEVGLQGYRLSDSDWQAIYEVCGGNAALLKSLANAARSVRGKVAWDATLKSIWTRLIKPVEAGLKSKAWSPEQYTTAVTQLLEHGGVIQTEKLEISIGADGSQALNAMVQANLLAYRPYSDWAADIPLEAYGDEQQAVYTAPNQAYLYTMRYLQLRGRLR